MATTTYTNFNGQIVSENRASTILDYMPDPLGSTAALLDSSQSQTDTWEYWPYGDEESHSGASVSGFTWLGSWGYFSSQVLTYVRSRFYDPSTAQWLSVDTEWPAEDAYQYADLQPVQLIDPSGESPSGGDVCDGLKTCEDKRDCCLDQLDLADIVKDVCGAAAGVAIGACVAICLASLGTACLVCLGLAGVAVGCFLAALWEYYSGTKACKDAYWRCKKPKPVPREKPEEKPRPVRIGPDAYETFMKALKNPPAYRLDGPDKFGGPVGPNPFK
jgi:RHS repeat-associated protein